MRARFVLAPKALLLDPALAASAKTTWLVLRLADSGDRHTTTLVAASTGLSVTTVSRGLAQLSARRWDRPAAPDEATVPIPQDLLTDPEIGVHAKVLYGVLQTFRSHSTRAGQFTYASVAQRSGISLNTVKQGVRELVESRWLKLEQKNQRAPIYFTLTNPERDRAKDEVLQARQRVDRAKHKGEALMREYLSLLIDSSDYEDNAYPVFLTNPLTKERLQLDRYYAPKVGFET